MSLLQRCLGIGYGRAARLIDFMAEDGIVGEYNGSQAREVLISIEDWEAMSRAKAGELASANGNSASVTAALPGGGQNIRPAVVDALPRYEKPSDRRRHRTRAAPQPHRPRAGRAERSRR